jgi:hypothetical protein
MATTINQRMTVEFEGEFVIFLIGMRINRLWKVHKWLPVANAMQRMLKELHANPDSGFLGFENYGIFKNVLVQYWRSFEHLEAYAKDRNGHHYPAWKAFNENIRSNGDVGIWHETYKIAAGQFECFYNNMPPRGLGRIGTLAAATGKREYAAGRIANVRT